MGRSRITNGNALLPFVDGRSTWARRLLDLVDLHTNDLGGADLLSTAEHSIVRRASCLTLELERLELKFLQQKGANADQLMLYQRCSNSLLRLLESLGLQRRPKDVTQSLDEYVRRRYGKESDDAAEAAE